MSDRGQQSSGATAADMSMAYRIAVVIASAMMSSFVFYAGILFMFRQSISFSVPDAARFALYAVSFAVVFGIRIVRQTMLQKTGDESTGSRIQKLMRVNVVTFVLVEVPIICGWVLGLLGAPISDFYLLGAFSLGLGVIYFPKLSQWREWAGVANATAP